MLRTPDGTTVPVDVPADNTIGQLLAAGGFGGYVAMRGDVKIPADTLMADADIGMGEVVSIKLASIITITGQDGYMLRAVDAGAAGKVIQVLEPRSMNDGPITHYGRGNIIYITRASDNSCLKPGPGSVWYPNATDPTPVVEVTNVVRIDTDDCAGPIRCVLQPPVLAGVGDITNVESWITTTGQKRIVRARVGGLPRPVVEITN